MHQFSLKKYDLLVSGEIHIYQSNVMGGIINNKRRERKLLFHTELVFSCKLFICNFKSTFFSYCSLRWQQC
jgi:hypothetical protein